MQRGGKILASAAILAIAGCDGEQGKLQIRPVSASAVTANKPFPLRVAEAHRQFSLGNVALALEGFRKAAREDPASVDAQAGIALCYQQMGRFDLSRRHYEMALAIAPRDPAVLAAFASSLDQQGKAVEAASVRRELAALAAQASELNALPAPQPAVAATIAPSGQASVAAAPEAVAPVVAAPVGRSVTIALPPPRPVGTTQPEPAEARAMSVAPVGRSVTIALPPPRPAPAAKPAAPAPAPQAAAAARPPRLERLSLTEVALVIGDGPRWKRPATQTVKMATRIAPSKSLEVRLLNAARVDKLAARTRSYLGRFGWRDIAVGDAAAVRSRSLIVYPKGTQAAASRLSARLGFAMAERANVRYVTVLLGRDAAARPGLRPKA